MTTVKEVYKSQIEMAAVRLVKEAPIMSKTPISNPEDNLRRVRNPIKSKGKCGYEKSYSGN